MRAYVLVEAAVGKAKVVYDAVKGLHVPDTQVALVDVVTGPFDVIVLIEADDLDRLGRAVSEGIQRIDGVQRTTTCLLLSL